MSHRLVLDLILQNFYIIVGRLYDMVLLVNLLNTAFEHFPYKKFAITKFTDRASQSLFCLASIVLLAICWLLEWTSLRQTLFARRLSTKVTVTIIQVTGLLPGNAAGAAPFRSVTIHRSI